MHKTKPWDYLIVTAANDQQAKSYEFQLRQPERARELQCVSTCLVIPDIDGRRIGSGGSTLHCLAQILERECSGDKPITFDDAKAVLSELRILIVHAGGDSRRLPAYSHCGKMFVPVPADDLSASASTLFDRLVPAFLGLQAEREGQILVTSGDALILFDSSIVALSAPGITVLGSYAPPAEASRHGVFCAGRNNSRQTVSVRRYLQKPASEVQAASGAINEAGESVLDIGVMSVDASAAVQLLRTFFDQSSTRDGGFGLLWKTDVRDVLRSDGIDLYREICCALGTEATLDHYVNTVRASGSNIGVEMLAQWFQSLHSIPLNLHVLQDCKFLHFGTTRQLITSGSALLAQEANATLSKKLILNCDARADIAATHAWIEGSNIRETLNLDGFNVVTGVDILEPTRLPKDMCLDVSPGVGHSGEDVWFLRYYGIDDSFKLSPDDGGTLCGIPLQRWLTTMEINSEEIWPRRESNQGRTLWNARIFPAEKEHQAFRDWLWLFCVELASSEQKKAFRAADRYTSSEIALRVDQSRFYARRSVMRARAIAANSKAEKSVMVGG